MRMDTVTVVICAYTTKRWGQVQAAVRSVLEQQPAPHQVVLVIDHCVELERLARDAFSGLPVEVVPNTDTKGLSGARNTGVRRATGAIVGFLDDDAVAQPGWLAEIAQHHADPAVLGTGGLVVPHWEQGEPRWFPREFGWVVGCSYTGLPTDTAEIRNPIGANMSFRRSVLDAVGGFSHTLGRVGTLPRGCEETELAIRARRAFPHGRILHVPSAVVHHHVPAERGRWGYFRSRCWSEGHSKADLSRLSDPRAATSSERSYVTRTLTAGVRRGLADAGRHLETAYLLQALMICLGLLITTAGFLSGHVLHLTRRARAVAQPAQHTTALGPTADAVRRPG